MQEKEMQVRSLGWEDPLKEEMATYLFQYYCLEKPHGQRSMVDYSQGRKEVDTTEHRCMRVHTHTHSPYKYCGFLLPQHQTDMFIWLVFSSVAQ